MWHSWSYFRFISGTLELFHCVYVVPVLRTCRGIPRRGLLFLRIVWAASRPRTVSAEVVLALLKLAIWPMKGKVGPLLLIASYPVDNLATGKRTRWPSSTVRFSCLFSLASERTATPTTTQSSFFRSYVPSPYCHFNYSAQSRSSLLVLARFGPPKHVSCPSFPMFQGNVKPILVSSSSKRLN